MRASFTLLLLALVGCSHSEAPTVTAADLEQPFDTVTPIRLTYSQGSDRTPSWSTDAGHIMYAFDRGRRIDTLFTGCVAELPAVGGSRGPEICETDPTLDKQLAMRPYWPARRGDGATAFVRQYWKGGRNPDLGDLVVQRAGEGEVPERIYLVPYFATPTATTHSGISHLQWLDATHLLYLGRVQVNNSLESVNSGIEIVIVAPDSGLPSLRVVPGTLYASSVARGANADTIYYTLGGDSLVYRRTLSTGVVDTAFDFGPFGIARDVQVRNGKLVAIVGGSVSFHAHATYGMVQDDFGGHVFAADLPAGAPIQLTPTTTPDTLYQHLALSPDGHAVITERNGDLWRIIVP